MVLIAMVALAGCQREPPEQAIRVAIARMQVAAEARDVGAIFAPIAEDFAGPEGMDRQAFRRFVTLLALRNDHVGVDIGPLEIKLFDVRATASFTAATRGGGGFLPDNAQVYRVETGWRLDDGEWMLISAKWQPVL